MVTDDMKVTLHLYDGRIMSASIPQRVTCTVVEAQTHTKGMTATPQYVQLLLQLNMFMCGFLL